MDLKDYKYRATFTSTAKIIVGPAQDRFLSKASLAPLKGIIPADVDLDSPDVLYFAANGAVAGMSNLNDDSVDAATAIAINKSAVNKFLNIGHNRGDLCGCILYTGFSRFGTNETLTEAEASALNEPFNMTVAGVIWKLAAPLVAKYIVQSNGGTDEQCLSLSWEVLFSHFDVAASSGTNVFDAKIINEGSADYAAYCKLLRAEGGSGKDPSGNKVFRVIKGGPEGDPIIVGYGIVEKPAAAVKGILPLEKSDVAPAEISDEPAAATATPVAEIVTEIAASESQSEKKIITPQSLSVKSNTPMKIESFAQFTEQLPELEKLDTKTVLASVETFVKSIEEGSKAYIAKVQSAEALVEQFKAAQATAETRAKELEEAMQKMANELAEIRASAEATALAQKFNDRMTSLSEKFELDEEETAFIAADVRAITTDEAFDSYAKKCDKLLAAKKKGAKPFPPKKDEEKPGDKKDDKEPDGDKDDGDMKAAVASLTEIPGQTSVPKVVEAVDESLKAQMAAAFNGSLKINGKPASEIKPAAK